MINNIFLDKRWQKRHLEKIKKRAGNRYTPKLNIKLPIADIFNGISRNKDFYKAIHSHHKRLNHKFCSFSLKYENKEIKKLYKNLKNKISNLSSLVGELKEYNTKQIPWDKISEHAEEADEILKQIQNKLREEERRIEQQKTEKANTNPNLILGKLNSDNYYLYKAQKELIYFKQLSSSAKARLANSPFLLLTGSAGIGKTHLLCDIVKDRVISKDPLPAILVFGELFREHKDPFDQIINQLELELNKDQLLQLLDESGKQSKCRAIIIIDALNETRREDLKQENYWKINLLKIVKEIKKYSNIAMIVSVRTGFEEEVLTKEIKEILIHEEHYGFESRELEAMNKFFKEFNLPTPEIPFLNPEFQNPLFLFLFCKAFQGRAKENKNKKKEKQIFRGHEGATYIFESFVDSVSKKISKQFKIPNDAKNNIWDSVIEKIAAEMVKEKNDKISEDRLIDLIKRVYPSIDHKKFVKELESNTLITKILRYSKEKDDYEGFDFRFTFQKFSDHLIGRYIFKEYEKNLKNDKKNLETAKKFFSRHKEYGTLLADPRSGGIIEVLSIQCPEHLKGHELVEVAPYLRDLSIAQKSFIESLIWRKPIAFSKDRKNTLKYIKDIITKTKFNCDNLLNAFLFVTSIPEHPFNANFLHKFLSKLSMAERDHYWSIFLHDQYGENRAVDRLIEWGWSRQDKLQIKDENIYLYSLTLSWFLTTTNRVLRDKVTKILVALLTNRLSIVSSLLDKFKDVNDLYVAERLYAVAYGCAIRSWEDNDGLKTLSQKVYEKIFKQKNPPEHILLRDYARGIIEVALHRKLNLTIKKGNIETPFNGEWIKNIPSEESLKSMYYPKDFPQKKIKEQGFLKIWSSVMYNFGMPGDFGNYILNPAVNHWAKKSLDSKEANRKILSNNFNKNFDTGLAQRWVFNRVIELGYDPELHGEFDSILTEYNKGKFRQEVERIGKKYQWIALYELLAKLSDNFEFKEGLLLGDIKKKKYEGPWQLNIRDLDPSCILKESLNERPKDIPSFNKNKAQKLYKAWDEKIQHSDWLKKSYDLPDPAKLIELTDDQGSAWITLNQHIEWSKEFPLKNKKHKRILWYILKSYLIHAKDKKEILEWAKQQNFMGRWMPESHDFYSTYLGEYPWAKAFLYHNNSFYQREGWTNGVGGKKIPKKILVTDDQYLSNDSTRDCSNSSPIRIKLPAKFIVDKMNLTQTYFDGRFFDDKNELTVFDPSIFDNRINNQLLIRKDKLVDFLKHNKYALFWTLLGEKNMIGDMDTEQQYKLLEINGAYTLSSKNNIEGSKQSNFK